MPLSANDKELLVKTVNQVLSQIPVFLRGAVSPATITGYLRSIPADFRHYTLQELIDAMEEANNNQSIKW